MKFPHVFRNEKDKFEYQHFIQEQSAKIVELLCLRKGEIDYTKVL